MSGVKRGKGITLGTSNTNRFKHDFLADVSKGLAIPEFRPLTSWPVKPHARQVEMDAFNALPSQYKSQ